MSSVTMDLDVYPHQIFTGQRIRCYDKSTYSGVTEWYARWKLGETTTWTISTPPSTHLNITNANLIFEVDEQVMVDTAGTIPTGLSKPPVTYWVKTVTTTYIEISTTKGGAAVQYTAAGSGTFTIHHASVYFNGLIKPAPVASITDLVASLYTYDSTVTLNSSSTYGLGYPRIYTAASAAAKPTSAGIYGRVTIFIYDSANATAINRLKSTNNSLFFQDLKATGSMNKAGEATFKVYDMGTASATEKGLMVADKNVAIIAGRNVIWTGKIKRAVQGKMSLYDTASPAQMWTVECESDIAKMRKQNVKAANQGSYTAPAGYIVNKLVENDAATDVDWRGLVEKSLISYEGPDIQYTISNADMYSQFQTLANLTGFDWRTRNNWLKYQYGASGYSAAGKTVTLSAITPYTTNSFAGRWLLFVNTTNADASSNSIGVRAYGNIASNTTTVITLTSITNDSIPPASSEYVIILGDPVVDFASDLQQPDYQCTFTANKARASTLQNAYEMNDKSDFKDIATKVIVKGKMPFVPTTIATGIWPVSGSSYSLAIPAKDVWDNNALFFENSTFVTKKCMGWIYSYTADALSIKIIGHGYAFQSGDLVSFFAYAPAISATTGDYGTLNAAPTEQIEDDGTPTTTLHFATPLNPYTWARYGVVYGSKIYVKSIPDVYTSGSVALNIGGSDTIEIDGSGLDALYGPYISYSLNQICLPHGVGALISKQTYTETSPETGSPIDYFDLLERTVVADQNVAPNDLDPYLTNYLVNHSYYYRKGGFWCFVYDWFKTDLRPQYQVSEAGWITVGDRIAVLQNTADTATDTQYGQYKNQWQILSWTLDGNKMTVSCELGDFERNTNTLINDKTTGINYTIT